MLYLVVLGLLLASPVTRGSNVNASSEAVEVTITEESSLNTTSTTTTQHQIENATSVGAFPILETPESNNTEPSLSMSMVTSGPNSTSDVTPSEFSTPTTDPHPTTPTMDVTTSGYVSITLQANVTENGSEPIQNNNTNKNVSAEVLEMQNITESASSTMVSEVRVNTTDVPKNDSVTIPEEPMVVVSDGLPHIDDANVSATVNFETTIFSSAVPVNESETINAMTSTLSFESSTDLFTASLSSDYTARDENATSVTTNANHIESEVANITDAPVFVDNNEKSEHSNATNIPDTNVTVVVYENSNTTLDSVHETNSTVTNSTIRNDHPVLSTPTVIPLVANVTDFGEFDNDTTFTSYDVNVTSEDNLTTTAAVQPWFMLQFAGNCSLTQEEYDSFEKEVRDQLLSRTGVPEQNVSVNMYNCSKSVLVNVSVSPAYEAQLSKFFKKLDDANHSKLHINDETYLVNVIGPAGNNALRHPTEVILSSRHTDIEFVIYVALGSACAFLLVLAVLLVTCKYCRTKPYKGFDVSDVSHLNLRLEDYTLTRIPRPKSIYADYCRGSARSTERYCPLDEQSANQTNGMVHAFDTSVVPLEDVPDASKNDEQSTEDNANKQKKSSSTNDYEEIEGGSVKSTENLHEKKTIPIAPAPWGVDNESFAS